MPNWTQRVGLPIGAVLLLLVASACYAEPVALTTFPPTEAPPLTDQPTDQPVPTDGSGAPATPTLVPTGVAAECVNGWAAPPSDNAAYGTGMYLIERQMEVVGPWTVDEMRYFTGPDVFWAETPAPSVERWYVKAALVDQDFSGRWLIEKRNDFDFGVVAVAPYDTAGYQTPDWTAFVGDGSPTTYLGLPGQWTGTPYDFVSGAGYNDQPGLPDEVIGCMSGT
jgi:hypothetical protein